MGLNKNYYGIEFFPDIKGSKDGYITEKTFKEKTKIKPTLEFKRVKHKQDGQILEPEKEFGVSLNKDRVGVYFKKKFKKGGLTKWFKEKWVDISRPKKKGRYQPCGRKSAKTSRKGYPKCVPLARARTMSKAQKRSAVRRKRAVPQGVGGRPTNVRTFTKRRRRKKK